MEQVVAFSSQVSGLTPYQVTDPQTKRVYNTLFARGPSGRGPWAISGFPKTSNRRSPIHPQKAHAVLSSEQLGRRQIWETPIPLGLVAAEEEKSTP